MPSRSGLTLLFGAAAVSSFSCAPSFPISNGGHASFDLSGINRPGQSFYFHDESNAASRNFTYIVNICGELNKPRSTCVREKATAYQIFNDGRCEALGSNLDPPNAEWKLLDDIDPTKGLSLTYSHGTYCPTYGVNRSLVINFQCENRIFTETTVEEKDCVYTITMPTEFGCPSECARPDNKVCGSNGFCGYDTDIKNPKCFCDSGWSGSTCLMKGSGEQDGGGSGAQGCDGVCVALIFVFLLLLALIAAAIVILLRVRKMNELNVRFAALAEDLNPDGEETFELQDTTGAELDG